MEGLKNKKIVVTGGTGFVGSHLVEELVNQGAQVYVLDIALNPKSYFSQNVSNKVHLEIIDVRNKSQVFDFFARVPIDYVFHLAAEPIVDVSFSNPYRTFETNIMGTVHILEAVRKNKKIKGIIAASSDKAYGKSGESYTEEFPLRGDHPYDVSKSAMDLICQTYFKSYNLPVAITRFGNIYGEGDLHYDRIVPGLCSSIANNTTLEIRSDGTFIRDYVYVKDVVAGYLTLLKKLDSIHGQAFNFSSKDKLSVLDLIKQVEQIVGVTIKYKILNKAKNEIPFQHLDDTKIKKLGWENKYTLTKAFPQVLEWYKQHVFDY